MKERHSFDMLLTSRERKEVACPVDDMYSSICMYVYICVCVYAEQCSPLFVDGDRKLVVAEDLALQRTTIDTTHAHPDLGGCCGSAACKVKAAVCRRLHHIELMLQTGSIRCGVQGS